MYRVGIDCKCMKKLAIILTLLLVPVVAEAAGKVMIHTTLENANGGTKSVKDIWTRIDYQSGQFSLSEKGVPTYELVQATIDPVDYKVVFSPPSGYSYTTHGDCESTVKDGELKTCYVYYLDKVDQPVNAVPEISPLLPTPVSPPVQQPQEPTPQVQALPIQPTTIIQYVPIIEPTPPAELLTPIEPPKEVIRVIEREVIREVPVIIREQATDTPTQTKSLEILERLSAMLDRLFNFLGL